MSQNKEVKLKTRNTVKFDFKIKGTKPQVTKEVCMFNITGADFNEDQLADVLKKHSGVIFE